MAAKDDLARAERALAEKQRQFVYNGVTYTLATLPGLVRDLRELRDAEAAVAAKEAKEVVRKPKTLKAAQKALADAKKNFQRVSERFDSGTLGVADVETARIAVNTAAEAVARLTPARAVTQPTVTAPLSGGRPPTEEEARIAQEGALRMGAAPTGGGGGAGGVGAAAPSKDKVPPVPEMQNILDELAQQFPAYRDWTLEQATGYFGSDLIQVFNDVAAGKYGRGEDKDTDAIKRAISGTQYWLNTEKSIRTWDGLESTAQSKLVEDQKRQLAQTFGELALDDATLTDLATTIQRTGLNDLGARQLVYGAAFTRPRTETGPQPRQLALESSVADEIRRIGKSYGYLPMDLDAQIESILTGKPYGPTGQVLTKDAFRQKAEKLARGSFGHLKDQFDSGLTLDDIFGNYRELASRVLEIDPSQIDFVQDPKKWLPAFGTAQTGQMSLSDWVTKLKSDNQYGWQFTNQAKTQATNLVMEMEKAFGFRR